MIKTRSLRVIAEDYLTGMDFYKLAEKALQGIVPEREEMQAVLDASDEDIPQLLSAAFKVRHHYFGKRVQIHMLMNAKSGLCPEDCHYCSQSSVSHALIPTSARPTPMRIESRR